MRLQTAEPRSGGIFVAHGRESPSVAVLTLGIGANAAIFNLIDTILFQSLPYPDPERMIIVTSFPVAEPNQRSGMSVPDYFAMKEHEFQNIEAHGTFSGQAVISAPMKMDFLPRTYRSTAGYRRFPSQSRRAFVNLYMTLWFEFRGRLAKAMQEILRRSKNPMSIQLPAEC